MITILIVHVSSNAGVDCKHGTAQVGSVISCRRLAHVPLAAGEQTRRARAHLTTR